MRAAKPVCAAAVQRGIIIAALLAATTANAQNTTTTTIPAPGADRYSLPPGNSQATPAPTPTPVAPIPTLTPAPPPSVLPTVERPRPAPSATPARVVPTAQPTRAPARPDVTPLATPTPVAILTATPTPAPTVEIPSGTVETPAPVAAAPSAGLPMWLWWAIGLALIVGAAFFVWRRFAVSRPTPVAYGPESATQEPQPPVAPTPSPPARPIAAEAQPQRALRLDLRPQRLWTLGPDAHLAFELVVTNTGTTPADAVRPVIILASAGPDTAAEITAFQANAATLPGGEPFALQSGETRTIAGELTLPGDAMYVTSAADRELIVPIVLVGLQWRAGLSLVRANDAFVIGTGDTTTPRLGPIWVDRAGLVYARLDARRFTPGWVETVDQG